MTTIQKPSQPDDFEIDWGDRPLIPEGEYHAVYVSHLTTNASFGPKVKITFRIVSMGPYYETLINGWYNAKQIGSTKRKGGKVIVSALSDLANECFKVLQIKNRVNRLSLTQLKGHVIVIKVRTVISNSKQKKLTEAQQYSTVDSMVCSLTTQDISKTLKPVPEPIPKPVPTSKDTNPCPI